MKVNTEDITGVALDWAVAQALDLRVTISPIVQYWQTPREKIIGYQIINDPPERDEFGIVGFNPSTDWSQGGPIMDEHKVAVDHVLNYCLATMDYWENASKGETMLIAAMRCIVKHKLGDTVTIPKELKNG